MKKLLTALMLVTMMLACGVASAANQTTDGGILMTRGVISEIKKDRVTVTSNSGEYLKRVVLEVKPGTKLLNGDTGANLDLKSFSKGMPVTAYFSNDLTRSNPPRSEAITILTGNNDISTAKYCRVGRVEYLDNGVRILDLNTNQYVTIDNAVVSYPNGIEEGAEVLTWYNTTSGNQAVANRAMVVSNANADVVVDRDNRAIYVRGNQVAYNANIPTYNSSIYVPLREVGQNLGYIVTWDQSRHTAELRQGSTVVNAVIGDNNYSKSRANIRLDNAPRLINGVTYVPAEFFSEVLGNTIQVIS